MIEAVEYKKPSLPALWAAFLDKPEWQWRWYGHYTFRDVVSPFDGHSHHVYPETAVKIWDRWIHGLNRETYGVKYWKDSKKGVVWARGTEFQNRGAIHFHALVGLVPDTVRRLDYIDKWYELAGFARIYSYEQGKGAEFYMSKSAYAWKRGEIDLGGPLAFHLDTSQGVIPF